MDVLTLVMAGLGVAGAVFFYGGGGGGGGRGFSRAG